MTMNEAKQIVPKVQIYDGCGEMQIKSQSNSIIEGRILISFYDKPKSSIDKNAIGMYVCRRIQ